MPIDHSNCDHPRTPAGRAQCRRQRSAGVESDKAPRKERTKRTRTKVLKDGTIRTSLHDRIARLADLNDTDLALLQVMSDSERLLPQYRGEVDMLLAHAIRTPSYARAEKVEKARRLLDTILSQCPSLTKD